MPVSRPRECTPKRRDPGALAGTLSGTGKGPATVGVKIDVT